LTVKSKYNLFPDLTPAEYAALKSSIADRGVDIPIIVDAEGNIIDGWHRQKACDELGIFCPQEVRRFDSDEEKLELAVTANAKRRQLNQEQKRALVAAYLKLDPTINDNWLAEMIGGMAKITVTKVRRRLEATLEIAKLDAFRGKDGKRRPRNYNRIVVNSQKEVEKAFDAIKRLPANGKLMDTTTAARHARRHANKVEREGKPIIPLPEDAIRIYHCPFQEVEKVAAISPASVNFFYADIPYDGGFVEQVADLAAMAEKVLVEGGICAVMTGQYYLDQVMKMLGKHLTYNWTMASVWQGDSTPIPHLPVVNTWKPILLFSKGQWTATGRWTDVSHVTTKEKDWHKWEQPLEEVETLVRQFSNPGELVLDPCGGGFTTAVACRILGRRCISCDVDLQAVLAGQERLGLVAVDR
jgi:ParB-like chromosome segregation protein Spo0J